MVLIDGPCHCPTGAIPYAGKAEIAGETEILIQESINQTNRKIRTVRGQMEKLGYGLLNPKTRFVGSRYSIRMAAGIQ